MAELKCSAVYCTYNSESLCCKGDILVGEEGIGANSNILCDSFRERGMMDTFTSSLDHPCECIGIDCDANKCVFNSDYKCVAKHVDIRGLGTGSAECATYQASF